MQSHLEIPPVNVGLMKGYEYLMLTLESIIRSENSHCGNSITALLLIQVVLLFPLEIGNLLHGDMPYGRACKKEANETFDSMWESESSLLSQRL